MASAARSIFKWPSPLDPSKAWDILKVHQEFQQISLPVQPQPPNTLRLVCISDTHNLTDKLVLPAGDVLVHAGDFSNVGKPKEVLHFNEFLSRQPFAHKVVIAGNHDIIFDLANYRSLAPRFHPGVFFDAAAAKASLTGCTYLEDSGCVIDGVKFWGSPWQPNFYDWAFNETRGAPIAKFWAKIPAGVDVLMTHGPPIGHGDICLPGRHRAGCVDLLQEIQTRIHPKIHVFGHIHEGYGATSDGHTLFLNASICTLSYAPANAPLVIDVPKPASFTPGLFPLPASLPADVAAAADAP